MLLKQKRESQNANKIKYALISKRLLFMPVTIKTYSGPGSENQAIDVGSERAASLQNQTDGGRATCLSQRA